MGRSSVLELFVMFTTRGQVAVEGDLVEIVECPPRSRLKRWDLVRVVEHKVDVTAEVVVSGASE